MKEPRDFTRVRLDPGQIWPFSQIAIRAGERQIARVVSPAMLFRNDVFDMETQLRKLLSQVAILTTLAGPLTDELAQRGVHQAALGCCKTARASALSTLKIEFARTSDVNSARSSG